MSGRTKSQAKIMMIKFIKATKEEKFFQFKLMGTEEDTRKFVHRMRVELSRMRDTVKDSGRVPKEFKVLVHELDFDPMNGITIVTLKKVEGKNIEIAEEINEIFDDIAGGVIVQ